MTPMTASVKWGPTVNIVIRVVKKQKGRYRLGHLPYYLVFRPYRIIITRQPLIAMHFPAHRNSWQSKLQRAKLL
jgi:hypothetical protein